jgi:hypothetical protein
VGLSEVNVDQSMFWFDNRNKGTIDKACAAAKWFHA